MSEWDHHRDAITLAAAAAAAAAEVRNIVWFIVVACLVRLDYSVALFYELKGVRGESVRGVSGAKDFGVRYVGAIGRVASKMELANGWDGMRLGGIFVVVVVVAGI